jgi:microcystin-dependent protein
MSTPFIGEIRLFGFNFAPKGWAFCQGQLLPINQNQALFSILGTTYGGNGQTTFALPDLRGRTAIHFGTGAGLPSFTLGQTGGEENHTLLSGEMPSHLHTASGSESAGDSASPSGNYWATGNQMYASTSDNIMSASAIGLSGGSQAHNNLQPYLGLNCSIALVGIFPSRN